MGEAFILKWVGYLQLKWVGQLRQSKFLLSGRYAEKKSGIQGSTLSSHRMTMGFTPDLWPTTERVGPLPTQFLVCEEPSYLVGTAVLMGIHSALNILLVCV